MARREWQNPSVLERDTAHGRVYYIRFRRKATTWADGKPKIQRVEEWRELGLCAKMTKRQAEREKDRILREVNNQCFSIASTMPWEDFARIFDANHIAGLAVPTQANYRQQMRCHITPAFKAFRLGQIGPLQVQMFFRTLESTLARQSRTAIRGILRAAFTCARKWKLIDSNPMEGVDVGGGPRAVRECRIPTIEDVRRLMELCDGDIPLLIETLCATGMRISEAAGLDVSDLDFAAGVIHVQRRYCRGDAGDTKSIPSRRDLPMGNVADALAVHVRGRSGPVFTYNRERIIDNALLDNYVTPRMRKLGIKFPGFGWHTFRRLHLSLMQRQGLTLFDLRRQAGHSSVRTTQRYIADDLAKRAEAARGLFVMRKGA